VDNVLAFTPRPTEPTNVPPRPVGIPDNAETYTVKEVAGMLRLSLGVTYDMLRSGDIPARLLGRRWIIPRDRFHTWLDNLPESTVDPEPPPVVRTGLGRRVATQLHHG
jgi:excisionase family DNA binding protein